MVNTVHSGNTITDCLLSTEGMLQAMISSWNGNISALLVLLRGIHRSPVNFPHKGQERGPLMFSLICAGINGWVNTRGAGDLIRHRSLWRHCNDRTECEQGLRPISITVFHAIQLRWKFRFALPPFLTEWLLQNFAHNTTVVLSWHAQKLFWSKIA